MGKRVKRLEVIGPTPEQSGHGMFVLEDVTDKRNGGGSITIGKAYRRRPMIDVLADQGLFGTAEVKALRHYRHHADIADRSPVRDSLNKQLGGTGTGPTVEMLNAIRVRDDCERAAGSLRDILRAVVVYDLSLSQWAITRNGATERCKDKRGKRVCWMEPAKKALEIAQLEIKLVARRVQAELDA